MLKALALFLALAGCAIGGYGVYVLTEMRDDQVEANCIARVRATPDPRTSAQKEVESFQGDGDYVKNVQDILNAC